MGEGKVDIMKKKKCLFPQSHLLALISFLTLAGCAPGPRSAVDVRFPLVLLVLCVGVIGYYLLFVKDVGMQKVVMKVNTVEALAWPEKCPRCSDSFVEGDTRVFEVKVKEAIRAFFVKPKLKKLSVKLCGKCSRRVQKFKAMESFGSALVLLAIIGALFLKLPPEQMYGAGATFWFGTILFAIGEARRTKAIGVKCMRLSKDKWSFRLRNDVFRNEFIKLNSSLVERN